MLVTIFEQILGMSQKLCLILPVILLGRLFLGKISKRYAYFLWGIVALRLMCPVMISSEVSLFHGLNMVEKYVMQEMTPEEGQETYGIPQSPAATVSGQLESYESSQTTVTEPLVQRTVSVGTLMQNQYKFFTEAYTPMGIISIIWLSGVLIFLGNGAISCIKMKRRLRFSTRLSEGIYECESVDSPFVFGVWKPCIYLPYRLEEKEKEYIIKHESCHIRRKDYLIKGVAFLLLGLYWFHPLVWLSYFLMSRDMGMSCDEQVIKESGKGARREYSSILLQFASEKRIAPVGTLNFGEKNVRQRIRHILEYKKTAVWSAVLATLFLVIVAAVCLTDSNRQETAIDTETEANSTVSKMAQELYAVKNPYIGDAVANGKLMQCLFSWNAGGFDVGSTELQTTKEPYVLTIHFDKEPQDLNAMWENAVLMLALIDNCGEVDFDYPVSNGEELVRYYISVEDVNTNLDIENIKDYGSSPEQIDTLLELLKIGTKNFLNSEIRQLMVYGSEDTEAIDKLLETLPDTMDEAKQRSNLLLKTYVDAETDYTLWDQFYEYVRKETPASLLMGFSTEEGDMIYSYLSYDGSSFYIMEDDTRDKWSSSRGYRGSTYSNLKIEDYMAGDGALYQVAYLCNDETVTYQKIMKELLSSTIPENGGTDWKELIFREQKVE